ncbi:MAG: DNA polymerase III subunit delta' [Candidatus Thorarchaeota archaeon]
MPKISIRHPKENPDLFGYDQIKEFVLENFSKGKLHHALLISGKKGIGKATFAYHLAYHMLSFENHESKNRNDLDLFNNPKEYQSKFSIDENSPTYSKIKAGSHPDLLAIEIETDEKTHKLHKEITVESIRKIKNFLNLTPAISNYRIVIVDSVDEMNINAANALLKALEEPPQKTFLFLISHNNKTLDTIYSRCQQLKIPAPNYDYWKKTLENLFDSQTSSKETDFRLLSMLSDNSISIALDIMAHDGTNLYHNIIRSLRNKDNLTTIHKLADEITANDSYWILFSYIINLLINRAIKLGSLGKLDFISEIERKILEELVRTHSIEELFSYLDSFNNLISDVSRININKKQVIINIFSKLLIL